MTHPEIYQQLKLLTPAEWEDIKTIILSDSQQSRSNYLTLINRTNPTAKDFFINAIVEDDYNSKSVQRQTVDWSTLTNHSLYRTTYTRTDFKNLIANLPKELCKYLPNNIATRLKKETRKKELANNTKTIQLNEFSYQVFKAQLQNTKKKLTGNEAIAQINALPRPYSKEEKEYYDKFLALFWDSLPKKSIDFCNTIMSRSCNTKYTPITRIGHTYISAILEQLEFDQNEVNISFFMYQKAALDYNIPVLRELYTDRYSDHHDWITGVSKHTRLNSIQLEMTISQVLILEYIVTNLQKDSKCPYFIKMLNHLKEELAKPIYKDEINTLLTKMEQSYTSTVSTIQKLKAI